MTNDDSQISEREREILRLLANGATNQQIAQQLNIALNTVKVHVRNIYSKLGVVSRSEATLHAIRSGLVSMASDNASPALVEVEQDVEAEDPAPAELTSPATTGALVVEPPPLHESAAVAVPIAAPPAVLTAEAVPAQTAATLLHAEASPAVLTAEAAPSALSAGSGVRLPLLIAGVALLLAGLFGAVTLFGRNPAPALTTTIPVATSAPAIAPLTNRWHELATLPAPRAGFALAGIAYEGKNYLYAIGGSDGTGVSGDVLRYDIASNVWVRFSPKPTPVSNIQAVVVGRRIFVPGGMTADGSVSAIFEAYDPQRDTWTKLAPLPEPRSAYTLGVVDGKIYLFGGWDGQRQRAEVWQYNPDTDTWGERSPMRSARAYASAATISGQVYVAGGEDQDGPVTRNERYNPAEEGSGNPWRILAPLPAPRTRAAAAEVSSKLFLFGGGANGSEVIAYNSDLDAWSELGELPHDGPFHNARAYPNSDSIIVAGGNENGIDSAKVYEFKAVYTVLVPIGN